MDFNLRFIAVLLFMMEFLASWPGANIPQVKHGRAKRVRGPCVGGKWIEVGSFRFWQRVSCGIRRDYRKQSNANNQGIDIDEIASEEDGPKRNSSYEPNYGYEPYWADGDWVFDKRPENKNDADYMCGTKCSKMYTEYGTICGRDKNLNYKTFENYCHLQSSDCHKLQHWKVLYKGACYRDVKDYGNSTPETRFAMHLNRFLSLQKEITVTTKSTLTT